MELQIVKIDKPESLNFILGQSHFIKTVEDIHEAMVSTVPGIKFGLAFCEASGPALVRKTGTDEELISLAQKNASALSAGHSFILFLGDGFFPVNVLNAVKMMTEVYREVGVELGVEIIHTVQFIEELLGQVRLRHRKEKRTVTFHDPCILSYDLMMSRLPREIITALGFSLKEPVYSRDHTHCCGASYGAKIGDHCVKDAVTSMRLNELRSTGADVYVTACPTCKSVLSEIDMKYITELVAERIVAKR